MSVLPRPEFHNEEAAYASVEARIWAKGRTCPHCGEAERTNKMGGKSTRIGTYKCYGCCKPFAVKIGTIFESSHVAMNLWLQAICLICASKKDISSNQLHRTLGHVDKRRIQRRIDVMSMKPRKLSAVLS